MDTQASFSGAVSAYIDDPMARLGTLSTGYVFDRRERLAVLVETLPMGSVVQHLTRLARRHRTRIVAGLAECSGAHLCNSVVIVGTDGVCAHYRKRCLSTIDQRCFDRGDRIEIFEVSGLRVGLLICFDVWFPELAREYLRAGIDLFERIADFSTESGQGDS